MPKGENVQKGKQGFQQTIRRPVLPTETDTRDIPHVHSEEAPSPAANYDNIYSHYAEKTGQGDTKLMGQNKCNLCGRFMDQKGNHECAARINPTTHKIMTIAPAVGAVTVFGVAAGVLALTSGYVIPIVIGAVVVAKFAVKRLLARTYAKNITTVVRKNRESLTREDRNWVEQTQDTVDELAAQMGVKGEVHLVYKTKTPSGQNNIVSPASASRLTKDQAVITVSPEMKDLDEAQLKGVLSHEMAHLQSSGPTRLRDYAAKAALPVGLAAGVASGLAVLPAASLAAAVWFTGKMASSAFSRREERRADKEAYKATGEDYAEALTELHRRFPQIRKDLPWRAEDVVFTHPNLPNRLADMRA